MWTEPVPACGALFPSFSSTWVGLGGFRSSSTALEQIGVEVDCAGSGRTRAFAWYELVPAPAMKIGIAIRPGDTIKASVTVVARRATLRLVDMTRHKTFSRTVRTPVVDLTAADWIVEAPSACFRNNLCRTLPLANFGTVRFANATATTASRRRGSISSRLWDETKIALVPSRQAYFFAGSAARAIPSALSPDGSAFAVTSSTVGGGGGSAIAAVAAAAATQPGGRDR